MLTLFKSKKSKTPVSGIEHLKTTDYRQLIKNVEKLLIDGSKSEADKLLKWFAININDKENLFIHRVYFGLSGDSMTIFVYLYSYYKQNLISLKEFEGCVELFYRAYSGKQYNTAMLCTLRKYNNVTKTLFLAYYSLAYILLTECPNLLIKLLNIYTIPNMVFVKYVIDAIDDIKRCHPYVTTDDFSAQFKQIIYDNWTDFNGTNVRYALCMDNDDISASDQAMILNYIFIDCNVPIFKFNYTFDVCHYSIDQKNNNLKPYLIDILTKICDKKNPKPAIKDSEVIPKQIYVGNSCVICCDEKPDKLVMLACGHAVSCHDCTMEVLTTNSKCPYCSTKINQRGTFTYVSMIDTE